MKRTIILMLLGAAALCSCEERFEIHPENYSNMIRLECVADAARDSVFIYPMVCVPAHVRIKTPPQFDITGLGLEIDGVFHKAENISYTVWERPDPYFDEDGMIHYQEEPEPVTRHRWAVPVSVPEGAELKIKASAAGVESVYGTTVVPHRPDVKIECTPYEYVEGTGDQKWSTFYLKVRIRIEDKANDTGYYALQMMEEDRHIIRYTDEAKEEGYEDSDDVNTYGITPENINSTSFDDIEDNSGITVGYDGYKLSYYYSGPMRLYKSDELEDSELYFRITPDFENGPNSHTIYSKHTSRFKIKLYRVSPEIYRYIKADELESNNELASLGLAPVNFTYSNIIGGSGYFGAWSHYEGEWTDNPFIRNNDQYYYYY